VDKLFSLILSGLVTGAIYSLIAAGLVVTYSTARVFNFAFGAIAFSTAFLYYELNTGLQWPVLPAAALSVLAFAPLLGLFCDRFIFRRLRGADESANVMAAVGLSAALPALTLWVAQAGIDTFGWNIPNGANIFAPPGIGPVPAHSYRISQGVSLNSNQVIVFAAAVISAVALWALVRRTRLGLKMRATVDLPELAEMRGVSTARTSSVAWIIGCLLAGVAGVVGAPVLTRLTPEVFTSILFVAATAAVIGGLHSVPLAFVGGLAIGVAQNLVAGYGGHIAITIPGVGSAVPFVLMLIGLYVLSRRRGRAAGSAKRAPMVPDYWRDLPRWRRWWPWILVGGLFALYSLVLADAFWRGIVARAVVVSIAFLSITVVTGFGRLVSLAQATLVTGAGLMMGYLVNHGWPLLLAALAGIAFAAFMGLVVALPSLRLGGLAFALGTLALALLGDSVLFAWEPFSGGLAGWRVAAPSPFGLDLSDTRVFIVFAGAIVAAICLSLHALQRSASGRTIHAVSTIEAAAASSGLSPARTKFGLFTLSALIAGIAGVLFGILNGNVSNSTYPAQVGLVWIATVVLMGVRRPAGAVVAAGFSVIGAQVLASGIHWPGPMAWMSWNGTTSPYIPQILFGLGAVQLAQNPYGILSLTAERNWRRRQKTRDARAAAAVVATEEGFRPTDLARMSSLALPSSADDVRSSSQVGQPAVALRGVSAGYGSATVLHGVDLVVPCGAIVGILGANGAGKSTLASVISGGVSPSAGRVEIFGVQAPIESPHLRVARGVALIPESRGIFPDLSVGDNLAVWLPTRSQRELAVERFPVLRDRQNLLAGNLSGGEQQMLALAPLLVRPPKIAIADEPTLGLAPRIAQSVIDVLRELREAGTTVVIIEEKAQHILGLADVVVFMETGRVVWSGPAHELDPSQLAAMYLGAEARHA
jgi:ABC-type branched-subunit amino acid transport system ATPase component/branched-subunit amino acid ABC-type transport system permease component